MLTKEIFSHLENVLMFTHNCRKAEKFFSQRNAAILHGINFGHQGASIFENIRTLAKNLTFYRCILKILSGKEFMTISRVINCLTDR